MSRVVVAGIGSEYRQDDGAGPAVARRVAELVDDVDDIGPLSDPLDLLGMWDGADLAVVIDGIRSGAEPGTVRLVDIDVAAGSDQSTGAPAVTSTHGIGLAGVLRLARVVGDPPQRVVVIGIEGAEFGQGVGLSHAVNAAVADATDQVIALIAETP